jgi:hypothetical protein
LAPLAAEASVFTLADTQKAYERDAVNSWHEPERIRVLPGKTTVSTTKPRYEFPPLSLTVLKFHIGKE